MVLTFLHRIFFLVRLTSHSRTGFQCLRILGLSSTRISNKLLLNGTLNHCKSLARLNLSRTRLSNKRLSHLVLPLLSQLNLDWTRVTSDCRTLLTGRIYIICWNRSIGKLKGSTQLRHSSVKYKSIFLQVVILSPLSFAVVIAKTP